MNKEYRKDYNFGDSSRVYIMAIIVPVIVSFIVSIFLAIISKVTGVEPKTLTSNIWIYSLLLLISQSTLFAVAFFYSKLNRINMYNATKLNNRINIFQIAILIIIAVVSLYLFLPFINFTDSVIRSWGYNNSSELPFAINTWWSYIIGLIVLALLPAVCEETVFRGVIYNGVKNKYNAKVAVIISALCFCIMHMSLQQFVYPLILGVVLALIVYYTGSLRASIFVHFLNNAIVVTTTFISSFITTESVEEPVKITLKDGFLSVVWLLVGVLIIFGCLMVLKLIKQKKENKNKILNSEINNETKKETVDEITEKSTTKETELANEKFDKSEKVMFIIFMAISIVFWIVENVAYF